MKVTHLLWFFSITCLVGEHGVTSFLWWYKSGQQTCKDVVMIDSVLWRNVIGQLLHYQTYESIQQIERPTFVNFISAAERNIAQKNHIRSKLRNTKVYIYEGMDAADLLAVLKDLSSEQQILNAELKKILKKFEAGAKFIRDFVSAYLAFRDECRDAAMAFKEMFMLGYYISEKFPLILVEFLKISIKSLYRNSETIPAKAYDGILYLTKHAPYCLLGEHGGTTLWSIESGQQICKDVVIVEIILWRNVIGQLLQHETYISIQQIEGPTFIDFISAADRNFVQKSHIKKILRDTEVYIYEGMDAAVLIAVLRDLSSAQQILNAELKAIIKNFKDGEEFIHNFISAYLTFRDECGDAAMAFMELFMLGDYFAEKFPKTLHLFWKIFIISLYGNFEKIPDTAHPAIMYLTENAPYYLLGEHGGTSLPGYKFEEERQTCENVVIADLIIWRNVIDQLLHSRQDSQAFHQAISNAGPNNGKQNVIKHKVVYTYEGMNVADLIIVLKDLSSEQQILNLELKAMLYNFPGSDEWKFRRDFISAFKRFRDKCGDAGLAFMDLFILGQYFAWKFPELVEPFWRIVIKSFYGNSETIPAKAHDGMVFLTKNTQYGLGVPEKQNCQDVVAFDLILWGNIIRRLTAEISLRTTILVSDPISFKEAISKIYTGQKNYVIIKLKDDVEYDIKFEIDVAHLLAVLKDLCLRQQLLNPELKAVIKNFKAGDEFIHNFILAYVRFHKDCGDAYKAFMGVLSVGYYFSNKFSKILDEFLNIVIISFYENTETIPETAHPATRYLISRAPEIGRAVREF